MLPMDETPSLHDNSSGSSMIKVNEINFLKQFILDCTCLSNIVLSSSCFGQSAQESLLGEYEEVCHLEDDRVVYGHADISTISYLYYLHGDNQWLLSSQIGDPVANIGISSLQFCPEDNSNLSLNWNVFTGEVS